MSIGDWIRLALALVAVGVIAFSTAVLIGFTASSNTRIAELATQGSGRARTVESLLDRSHHLQSTMIFLDTSAVALASALVTNLAIGRLPSWGVALVVFVAVVVMLVFGRAVPRALALRLPDDVALACARLARVAIVVFAPVTAIINGIATAIIAALRVPAPSPSSALATEEELIQLVREEAGDNRIEEEEVDMVNSIFRFTDTTVRDVMAPRVDMVGVPREATVREAVDIALEAGHSRLPVYEESLDRIVGIVYAKDLLRFVGRANANAPIVAVMRAPIFVPEGKALPELLRELQARRVHIAIVIDEYGGTAGLVTIEDILEEIVGEIQDEYDAEPPLVESQADGSYIVNAKIEMHDFEQLMDVHWANEEQEREPLAGFIYDRIGRIPEVGEEIRVDPIVFTVLEMDNQRLGNLRVVRATEDTSPVPREASAFDEVPAQS
ncbi:MAG: hemolysin family protein [Thermomicrobiales bacterium]